MKLKQLLVLCCLLVSSITIAQQRTITGNVTDGTQPLPGVNIVIKGTTTGTQTDFDGNYSISAETGDVLVFSFVGMVSKEVTIAESDVIDVTLESSNVLDEVIVTAVGIKRKPDEITTAYENVKAEEIVAAQNPDAVQALAGKVSGLQINTTSTGVTPNTQILLRGSRSLTGDNEALIVIDNVISTATILSNLDPESIEAINILKGPNGAALYGSRGGNGVVVVTTKKGSSNQGKVQVGITSSVTFEEIAFLPQLQDRYGKGYWGEIDAFDQGSWGPEYDGSVQAVGLPFPTFNDFRYGTYSFKKNNIKPFFDTGLTLQNTISISGGDSEGYFNLSANRRDTDGLIPNDEFRKDFFSLNAGKTFGKLSVSGIARFSIEDQNTASAYDTDNAQTSFIGFGGDGRIDENTLYGQLFQVPSDVDIRQFSSGDNADHWTAFGDSPYWVLNNSRLNFQRNISDLSAEISYTFNDNISATLRGNYVNSSYELVDYLNEFEEPFTITGDGRNIISNLELESGYSRRIYVDALANFNYQLTEDIELKSLIGFNFFQRKAYFSEVFGTNLTIPGLYNASNISTVQLNGDASLTERTNALFANVDLSYKDYLFLNLTARNDWNSNLQAPGSKLKDISFFYPSVGVAFIPTKAFPELRGKVLHKAKVSGGYVRVGNIGALTPHRLFEVGSQAGGFPISGVNSFVAGLATASNNIEPEFVSTFEANLNLEFLHVNGAPRITLDGTASFYKNENQVLNTSISSATGATQAIINVGETKTDAFEVDLGFTPIKTENFRWDGNIGFSTFKTEVVKVTDDSDIIETTAPGTIVGVLPNLYAVEGEEFPLIRGSAYQRDDQGRVIVDNNGVPQTIAATVLGKTTPDYILNFGTEVSYKGLTFRATADYRTGHVFYSNIYNNLTGQGRSFVTAQNGRGHFIFPNSTVQGTGVANTTVLTGPSYGGPTPYAEYQSFVQSGQFLGVDENFVVDATAFKLREVALSYTLPSKLLEKTFINGLSFGVSGRNLWTSLPKENRGYNDPEIGNGIGNFSQTPPTRFYTMNINLTF